jgi:hypothetical protein
VIILEDSSTFENSPNSLIPFSELKRGWIPPSSYLVMKASLLVRIKQAAAMCRKMPYFKYFIVNRGIVLVKVLDF